MSNPNILAIKRYIDSTHPVIVLTALQYLMQYGSDNLKDSEFIKEYENRIRNYHANNPHAFTTLDFDLMVLSKLIELSQFAPLDIIRTIQKHHIVFD